MAHLEYRCVGGPLHNEMTDLGDGRKGVVVIDRPGNRAWIYDICSNQTDGAHLLVREQEGRELDDDKRFEAGEDLEWKVLALDQGEVDEEVGR